MAFDEKTLRSFLVKQPRPARVLVKNEDGDVHEIAPPDGRGVTWSNVARSIVALSPSMVEVYDSEGKILRASRGDDDEPNAEKTPSVGLSPMHTDPETARLTHFANLLFRATEFSTTLAFTKMVELFQLQAERSNALETRLERTEATYRKLMQERIEEAFDQAEEIREQAQAGNQDAAMGLLSAFMGGAANGKAERNAKG